jgi:hypothetical protein
MKKQALFMTLVLNFVVITVKAEDAIVYFGGTTFSHSKWTFSEKLPLNICFLGFPIAL